MQLDKAQRNALDVMTKAPRAEPDMTSGMGIDRSLIRCPKIGQVVFYPSRRMEGEPDDAYAIPRKRGHPQQFVSIGYLVENARRRNLELEWVEEYLWARSR